VELGQSEISDDNKKEWGNARDKALAKPTMARWLEETIVEQPYHGIKAIRTGDEVDGQTTNT
jgi:hypothetical protein